MRYLRFLGHPVMVISFFLLLLISGESFGGPYAMYILMGLPACVPDTLLAVFGIGLLVIGHNLNSKRRAIIRPFCYIIGDFMMILSLILFFQVTKGYNNATFHQTVPLISFTLFGHSLVCNLLLSAHLFAKKDIHKSSSSINIVS